jgi:glutaredoxin
MIDFLKMLGLSVLLVTAVVAFLIQSKPYEKAVEKHQPASKALAQSTSGQCAMIKMYSMSWCGACARARKKLKEHGVAYKEYVLDRLPKSVETAFEAGARRDGIRIAYPTYEINGKFQLNYSPKDLIEISCETKG